MRAFRRFFRLRRDGRPTFRGVTHAVAAPLALVGAVALLRQSPPSAGQQASVAVFGVSLVGLYGVSSLYHVGRWSERARWVLGRCDAGMIQLFIAGTFTPIALAALDGVWQTASLVTAWVVALAGAAVAASPLTAPRWLSTSGYLAAGWLLVIPFSRIMLALPAAGSSLIVLGGVCYTIGAVVYIRTKPDPWPSVFGFHEVFHLLVLAGSCAHYLAIWGWVLPSP